MATRKGTKRLTKRYSPLNPKSVNYYEKLRRKSARIPPVWKTHGPSWSKILKDLVKNLFARSPSAPFDYPAREAADRITRIIRGKNLQKGFFQLYVVDEVSRIGTLRFMAEFLRYKRNEYGLIGFLVENKLLEVWITMGSRTDFSFYPDSIVKRAVEIGCSRIIFGHNHPAPLGTLAPSQEDYQVKKALESQLTPLSIEVESYIFTRGRHITY